MPILSTVNGSFFAGRRSSAFAASWNPATDITTAFWIDASDTSSYTISANVLTSVTDKSGNFSITIGGNPQRLTAALNGLNVWDFNGNYDLTTAGEGPVTDGSGNHWAIGVFLADTVNDTQDSFYSFTNNTVAATSKRGYAVSAGNASAFDGELDLDSLSSNRISTTIGNKQDFDSAVSLDAFHLVGTIFNKTGNQIAARVDGSNAFTPVNDYDNSINTDQDVRIMRNRANERLDGQFAEFFVVGALPGTGGTDITEFEKAEGYLAHKWGLTANLPVDHPYKNSAPTSTQPSPFGLQLYYDPDNTSSYPGSGTTVTDLSPNGYTTGRLENGVGFSDGSFTFDATDDYIDTNQNIAIAGSYTINAWAKNTSDTTDFRMVVGTETADGSSWNYRIYYNTGNGKVYGDVRVAPGPVQDEVVSTAAYNDSAWHMLTFVRNTSTQKLYLYIDGVLDTEETDATAALDASNAQEVWIGRSPYLGGRYPFGGNIGEVLIYDRALTSAEVLINYNRLRGNYGL